MGKRALLVGNSDGMGLATTRKLIDMGWNILGISRSQSSIKDKNYKHLIADVSDEEYPKLLKKFVAETSLDLCIYFVGVGELLDLLNMENEVKVIDINLTGMVKTAAGVIPRMVERGEGHFMGISSVADELLSAEAPSYHASKAGLSNYLGGLAIALEPRGVKVTNIRFGFVDTKMAKGDVKPFMMSVEKAVECIELCIREKPVLYTAPRIVVPLVRFRRMMMKLG